MASFRSEFLGATAPLGAKTQDEWQKDIVRRLDQQMIALGLLALREHLKERPSLPHPEPARAATGAERCSPSPSGGAEPSEEEIRVVAEKIRVFAFEYPKEWRLRLAERVIRALDEYRASPSRTPR